VCLFYFGGCGAKRAALMSCENCGVKRSNFDLSGFGFGGEVPAALRRVGHLAQGSRVLADFVFSSSSSKTCFARVG
jgi:hypothetical protein